MDRRAEWFRRVERADYHADCMYAAMNPMALDVVSAATRPFEVVYHGLISWYHLKRLPNLSQEQRVD